MKFFTYTILSILSVLFVMHIAVTFKDWSEYGEYITQELEKEYNAKIRIMGKVDASLIMPKLTVHDVYIQYDSQTEKRLSDLISIGKVEIRPSLSSLFSFSLQPKSITLINMQSNRQNLLNMINTRSSNNIANFIIKNGHINIDDDCIKIKEINVTGNKKFSGTVQIDDNHYDFSGKINATKTNLDIRVESQLIDLLFKGNKDQEKINGNLVVTADNSFGAISNLAKLINLNSLSHLMPDESIKISSNVNMDDSEFKMTDLRIESTNSVQASGSIHNDSKSNHTNINLNFSKIDLDFMKDNSHKKVNVKDLLECFKKTIPKNLSLDFNIEALNVSYQKKLLDNFRTTVKFANSEAIVKTIFKLPGINNMFHLSGKVSNNNELSEFNGNLQVEGNDFKSFISYFFPFAIAEENKKNQFTLHSKVHLGPRVLLMSNVTFLNDEEFLQGSMKISYTKKHNMIDGELSIHNLNADQYNFGTVYEVKWLKDFKYDLTIKTSINDLILNNEKIKSVNFLLNVEENKLVANKIKIHGKDFDTSGNVKVSMNKNHTKPLLDIDFNGKKFNGNVIKLPDFIEKEDNSKNEKNQVQWSTKKFNFIPKIEHFDAKISINTEKFKIRQSNLEDFHLDALIGNSIVTVRQVSYTLEKGKLSFQGYLTSNSIYTQFFILDLEVSRISELVGINNVEGRVSLSGTIKTQGKSLYDWANNYSGEIKLGANQVTFSNIDLNSFIINLLNSKNRSEIAEFANVAIYNGSTPFKNLIGKVDISNGVCSTNLQFQIDRASGSASANLQLSNFSVGSIFRFFFIPPNRSSAVYIDMHLDGPIWRPKISFDIDEIFATLSASTIYS